MQKTFIYIILFACSYFSVFADKSPHFSSIVDHIVIKEDGKGFQSDVVCKGFTESESSNFAIYYTELESIEKLFVHYEDANNKIKKLDKDLITNSAVITNNFYTGDKGFYFRLPHTHYFDYSYTRTAKDLMLFSNLIFRPEKEIDTVIYEVLIPAGYSLVYTPFEIDSTINISIDSVLTDGKIEYRFEAINHKILNKNHARNNFFISEDGTTPSVKLIVVPFAFKSKPEVKFNEWYSSMIESLPLLDEYTLNDLKNCIVNTVDTDSIVKKIFRFVQKKIKYLDIENGIQGFKPHNANETYLNKEGDCKDMAFLLYRLLQHFHFNAHLALSASLKHYYDMDFPTIACADHMICVFEKNDRYIYLDATDDECEYGYPSLPIQGRHIFIIDSGGGQFQYVPIVKASENKTSFQMELQLKDQKMQGSYKYDFRHTSSVLYRTFLHQLKKSEFDLFLKNMLTDLTPSVTYNNIYTLSTDSSFTISGDASFRENVVTSYANKNYIPLNFLPCIDPIPKTIYANEKITTYSTLNKITEIRISFPDSLHAINERDDEYSEGPFNFKFSVKKTGTHEIKINSSVVFDDVIIKAQDANNFNKIIAQIKYELNKGIVYE